MCSFFLEGVDIHMKRNGDHLVEHCQEDVLFSNILGWEKLCTQVLGPIIAVSRGPSANSVRAIFRALGLGSGAPQIIS